MLTPEILAEISLLATEAGGRLASISSGEFRGVLGVDAGHFSVRWFVPAEGLEPGGRSGRFGVQFLFPELALPHFPVGTSFSVWEGKDIGVGTVLQVYSDPTAAV